VAAAEPQGDAVRARHPLVEKILSGTAPEAIRMIAARGALPLPLQDLVYAQICLLHDELPQVVQAATESLAKLAGEALLPILRDPGCEAVLVDHFVRSGRLSGDALEAAIAHPAIMDATLESAATTGTAETLNLIVTNEVRIIKTPHLLEILRANPNLSSDNRRRLQELERDFIGKEQLRVRPSPVPAAGPLAEALPEGAAAGEAPAAGEEPPADDAAAPVMTEEEEARFEEELKKTPVFQKIMKMNVAERVQLAMKGNAEERAILIRDTAKMVAHQVLKSPKLSDSEVASFAKMRNIHEDMLRVIASRKDWTKTYATVHALVRNPKTPAGLTIQFLPRLGNRDLKIVCGDKNIPELVRRQARNLFLIRTQPPKKMGKKAH
jgi:hypothetical protein